ncbi:transporter substrate-binding domain-containing protein [Marinobacter sp. CHS3-4]|uniref:substrate-binding periplasmic protein n=1 Tax=Marinobacter sp. CHS3-4 TaxID=3045174 RepID=UPI0024B4B59D|nr:transporter substrate-binding domain-containing protein [Marinobacter sp. CHS3-4]MDI9243815.1 transporter substrate-binding domain-containing protein [Marinobacter sp. CHS3-4]
MIRLALLSIALGYFCSGVLAAEPADADRPVLRTGFVEFPPFKYADEQGEASGPWVEMTEKVAEQAGYRLDWVHLPIARVYLYLKTGQIDLWPGVAGLPMLANHVVESQSTPMRVVLYAYHESTDPAPDDLEFLEGKRLILIKGFSYLGVLESLNLADKDLSRAPDHETALRMLELDRGQYLLDYDAPVEAELHKFPDMDVKGTPIFSARGALVVSKKYPDARELSEKLDAAYHSLAEDGVLEPLF